MAALTAAVASSAATTPPAAAAALAPPAAPEQSAPRAAAAVAPSATAVTKLLRFPDVWHDQVVFSYAGDLWTVTTAGGRATRLTANKGLELFGKFSPDGRWIAFTAQYGGDEQVYVMPAAGGTPRQLTFYPSTGPLPDRWGFDNQVYGWTPDGTAVLFRSARDGYQLTDSKLYTVPRDGGAATALPMPVSGAGHYSPDGRRIVYSPLWRDFRNEKGYQGGWANDLYIFDLGHPALTRVTDDPHTDRDPMWVGGAVYFNSDRSGTFNLYRYDVAGGGTEQLTYHQDWDVRWPSADADGHIVYELDGALRLYDTRSRVDRALAISVPTDATPSQPQPVNAADNLESLAISPGGERLAVVGRGDVFTVPVEHGVTRNLTHSSDAHDREAAWSSDGTRLAYLSDRSGEEELYVQAQDGSRPALALTSGSAGRYMTPRWSPDGRRIALADQTGRLYAIDVKTRERRVIAKDPLDPALDYQWSPDGRYLAYSLNDPAAYSGVYVWSVADSRSRRVTPEYFDASTPAWAPNGEWLYFLSQRDYQPLISTIEFDFATDRRTGIFAVALRRGVENPFGVRDDEPGDGARNGLRDDADSQGSDEADHRSRVAGRRRADAAGGHGVAPFAIEFDGIAERVARVPLDADNLSELQAGEDTLFYRRSEPSYYGRESAPKSSVMAYAIKDREAKTVAEDVAEWS